MFGVFAVWMSIIGVTCAQTIIPGPTISGGTWSLSGSPYYITGNSTLATGQTLTIQPGVVVEIGAGVSITANGTIQAVGTSSQNITFQSFIPSQYWSTISVNGTAGTNQFEYCNFQNASAALTLNNNSVNEVSFSSFQNVTNGISMRMIDNGSTGGAYTYTQTTTIMNCAFSNCVAQAVSGQAIGASELQNAVLNSVVENCYFISVGSGCSFYIAGGAYIGYFEPGYGSASLQFMNNIFNNVANTAISMTAGSFASSSQLTVINNTLVNCAVGVYAVDPWDGEVQNSVFVGCTNAVQDTGSLLRNVSFNDFYANATNFTGYNANYGTWIIPNRNGTISDVSGNIGQNPLFIATNSFRLSSNSPCIDAGNPASAYDDTSFPPSQGTTINDQGAYGGPQAWGWPEAQTTTLQCIAYTNLTQQLLWQYTPPVTGSGNTFGLSNAPSGMTVNSSTGTISWTPTPAQAGTIFSNITYLVYQSGVPNASATFSVVVNSPGTPPTTLGVQTIVPGPTISGGTWSLSGSPYYITGNSTLATGQTLTIQPGVVVEIGAGVSITANGTIQAVGTSSQNITFQSFIPSQYWSTISVNGTAGTNQFEYCNFQNASAALTLNNNSVNEVSFSSFQNVTNGISMRMIDNGSTGGAYTYTQTTTIMNCAFSNCVAQAVSGQAIGASELQNAVLNSVVENCYFISVGSGCSFYIAGGAYIGYFEPGYGSASLQFMNNIFNNVANTAISMTAGSFASSSQLTVINNTLVNCAVGVYAVDPWDGEVQNSVFVGCTNAVQDTGSLLRNVSFNDFYANATNFTGYNANYGTWIIPNRNGTISDVSGNIGQNPLFIATNSFRLSSNSPCIDAGNPASAYDDTSFPPSQGTVVNDQGIYGGPLASNWLIVPVVTWTNSPAITYGTALSANQLNVTANVAGSFTCTPPLGTILNSGSNQTVSVVFTPTQTSPYYYYTTVTTNVSLTVLPAPLTITATNQTKTYGQTLNFSGTEFTTTGLVNGDTVTGALIASAGSPPTAPVSGLPYTITITNAMGDAGLTNYNITYVSGSLTVTPALLTVTADPKSRAYGAANPALAYTITGYQNGENATTANMTGTPTLSTTAAANSSVAGSPYTISCGVGTLAAPNYSFTAANGQFTVTAAPLIVTADSKSRAYGAANPALTYTITGYQNGENASTAGVTGAPILSTTAAANSSVAGSPYTISCGVGTLAAPNYSFTAANGQFTVTAAPLIVTADSKSRAYGAANPALTYTITGYQNGENASTAGVTGAPILSTPTVTNSPVAGSPYTISCGVGTLAAPNYSFTASNGQLTVTPALLTVTADPKSRAYGAANPAFTYTISGYQNGENASTAGVTGTPTLSTVAAANSSVAGSPYTISCGVGTLAAPNYSFTASNGQLTVTTALLSVAASPQSKTYGQTLAFGSGSTLFTSTNLQNGETIGSVMLACSGGVATAQTNTYPITISAATGGTFSANNYTITYYPGTLTVTPAALSVAASPQSKTYGQTLAFGSGSTLFTSTNLQNGETIASVTLACTGGVATAPTNTCAITISAAMGGTFSANNYTITYYPGTLTVNPAALAVATSPQSKTYGQTLAFGSGSTLFSSTNLQNGETIGSVTLAVSGNGGALNATVSGSPYTITPSAATGGTFNANNYTITYFTNTLTVNRAALSVTANNTNRPYGAPNPIFTDTIVGLVSGDNITATNSCSATITSPATNYAIIPSLIDPSSRLGNYSVAITNGVLTVTPAIVLSAPSWLGNGQFKFSFNTAANQNYTVQYSTDLSHWTSLVELGGDGSPLTVTDFSASTTYRYYRVISP